VNSRPDGAPNAGLAARAHQVAILRAHLADLVARADVAIADAESHAREATAQRERAERAEREAHAQRERAEAREAELERLQARFERAHQTLEALRTHPAVRAALVLRRLWRRAA
jgi:chromosome segregation ATPase